MSNLFKNIPFENLTSIPFNVSEQHYYTENENLKFVCCFTILFFVIYLFKILIVNSCLDKDNVSNTVICNLCGNRSSGIKWLDVTNNKESGAICHHCLNDDNEKEDELRFLNLFTYEKVEFNKNTIVYSNVRLLIDVLDKYEKGDFFSYAYLDIKDGSIKMVEDESETDIIFFDAKYKYNRCESKLMC